MKRINKRYIAKDKDFEDFESKVDFLTLSDYTNKKDINKLKISNRRQWIFKIFMIIVVIVLALSGYKNIETLKFCVEMLGLVFG